MSIDRIKSLAVISVVIFLICICLPGFSQKVSEKKDISLFKLSYYKYTIPNQALGSIDEQIKSVFINLGRFNVLGMTYRLSEEDINQFIDKIKEFKQANVEISESFKMGHEVFTEKDLNQLVGSFIVVVPTVSYFNTRQPDENKKEFETEIKTSFTFIDVEKGTTFAHFFVEGTGTGDDKLSSMQRAVESIPAMLEYEITRIFTLETGILEVKGGEVVIELGKNMGIKQGYEFEMVNTKILSSGHKMEQGEGLLIIKDVQEEVSFGNVIFGDALEGSQLKEIPRVGVEGTFYVNALVDILNGATIFGVVGLKTVASKGFYNFRPFAGIEFPLPLALNQPADDTFALPVLYLFGIPMNFYLGGEIPLYLGRLVIAPQLAAGVGFFFPYEGWDFEDENKDNEVITHYGGFANLNISYFFARDFKVTLDVGYKLWWAPTDILFRNLLGGEYHFSYGGVMIGGGVIAKL